MGGESQKAVLQKIIIFQTRTEVFQQLKKSSRRRKIHVCVYCIQSTELCAQPKHSLVLSVASTPISLTAFPTDKDVSTHCFSFHPVFVACSSVSVPLQSIFCQKVHYWFLLSALGENTQLK